MKTVPLKHAALINDRVLPESTSPDYAFAYVDISQVSSDGVVSIPTEMTTFADAPSRARRLARAGAVVVSTVRTYLRAIAQVPQSNMTLVFSSGFAVLEPRGVVDPRFLGYACRADRFVNEVVARSTGVSYPAISPGELGTIHLPSPSHREQRRIADFLDDQVSRIDSTIAARRRQVDLGEQHALRTNFDMVSGADVQGSRRPSGIRWLGSVPGSWPVLTVNMEFEVLLGKMLDERRITGKHPVPYLRNTNVQWDEISTDDLKVMDIGPDEIERFAIRSGDLLICEGGQPGRCATWDGRLSLMGFQKALHRARSRGRSRPAWLAACLKAAVSVNAFAVENEQTTIGHLTNEQLRGQRFPFPESSIQEAGLTEVEGLMVENTAAKAALLRSIDLLTEYKQSLITAAVTGELDVTTASRRVPV